MLHTQPDEIKGKIPTIRIIAMPRDTNPFGDIFGGWLVSNMDLAGGTHCYKDLGMRVSTVGINGMSFCKPVFVGDEVSFYTSVEKTGKTSISINVESWAFRRETKKYDKVTEGSFTYVCLDENNQPTSIIKDYYVEDKKAV